MPAASGLDRHAVCQAHVGVIAEGGHAAALETSFNLFERLIPR